MTSSSATGVFDEGRDPPTIESLTKENAVLRKWMALWLERGVQDRKTYGRVYTTAKVSELRAALKGEELPKDASPYRTQSEWPTRR